MLIDCSQLRLVAGAHYPPPHIPLHHRLGVERHGFERVDGNDDGSSGGVDLVWLMEDET